MLPSPDFLTAVKVSVLTIFNYFTSVTCLWRHRTSMTNENRPQALLFEELWNFRETAHERELAYAEHDDARNWHH